VHAHERAEHVYYILSGKGVMTLGDRTFVVSRTPRFFIPPGLAHAIDNTGLENLVFIVVNVPADELAARRHAHLIRSAPERVVS